MIQKYTTVSLKYEDIKYLPDNYIVKVNQLYLFSVLALDPPQKIQQIIYNLLNSIKKGKAIDHITITITDLKQIVEFNGTSILQIYPTTTKNEILDNIKECLKNIISKEQHGQEMLTLLENPETTLNQVLSIIEKVHSSNFKEACLILYKIKIEEHYNQKINSLVQEKTLQTNAITKILKLQKKRILNIIL